MSLREEQCNKVCRILDDVLANRPTERDSLILAVRKAFAEPQERKGKWIPCSERYTNATSAESCRLNANSVPNAEQRWRWTMSDDLISRQALLTKLNRVIEHGIPNKTGKHMISAEAVRDTVWLLPSAEPQERTFEIQDILDYLDTVLHPIVSPEHWNVYSELHDMISTLQSAQQERTTGRWERKTEVKHETD